MVIATATSSRLDDADPLFALLTLWTVRGELLAKIPRPSGTVRSCGNAPFRGSLETQRTPSRTPIGLGASQLHSVILCDHRINRARCNFALDWGWAFPPHGTAFTGAWSAFECRSLGLCHRSNAWLLCRSKGLHTMVRIYWNTRHHGGGDTRRMGSRSFGRSTDAPPDTRHAPTVSCNPHWSKLCDICVPHPRKTTTIDAAPMRSGVSLAYISMGRQFVYRALRMCCRFQGRTTFRM
jgi:hypothetical protein